MFVDSTSLLRHMYIGIVLKRNDIDMYIHIHIIMYMYIHTIHKELWLQ